MQANSAGPQQKSIDDLLDVPEDKVLAFLGMQSERVEVTLERLDMGDAVPPWTDADTLAKVTDAQRLSAEEFARYLQLGADYARGLLVKLESGLRSLICDGGKLNSDVAKLEGDVRELTKYLVAGIAGLVATNLPAAVAAAATSIATALAVLLIKRRLTTFCAMPA